ncbi:tim10/DDP family zinc finger domain-containing protein [Rhizoctonia solani AG-1 IA]|uniref:Mitochondrial import inner membrane translocase subunit n=1 Tax=Thanatephorus cucumeris (strain AG1-IA) TaxID=983506 RepID=L8X3X9_THACA|nr:tim10/DDP family zinc finger domain-containing protein [Rhizoctonia solani AG-1 IA]
MSMFGIGGGNRAGSPSGSINPAQIEMATMCWMYRSCHSKCISTRYTEPDLNKGESVCIDRCVAKFFEVNRKVGEKLQNMGQSAAGAGSGSSFGF